MVGDVVARKQLIDLEVAKRCFLFATFGPASVFDVVVLFGRDVLDITADTVVVSDDETFVGNERRGGEGRSEAAVLAQREDSGGEASAIGVIDLLAAQLNAVFAEQLVYFVGYGLVGEPHPRGDLSREAGGNQEEEEGE